MHEAATEEHKIGDARNRSTDWSCWRVFRASLTTLVALLCGSRLASAQLPPSPLPLSNTEDARTLPKGVVLFRALNAWTRISDVYDAAADSAQHLHPLGNSFAFESLGVRHFPGLAAAQSALRTLTGDPNISLNLGQTFATADTRIVTTPFSLSYGVTNRLTIGAMVPLVQTQTNLFIELNPRRAGTANINVGPTPTQDITSLQAQLSSAAIDLTNFINNCTSSSSCSAQQQEAIALLQSVRQDSVAVAVLYGPNSRFAPFGTAQTTVSNQLDALAKNVGDVTGGTYSFSKPAGAQAQAALFQLQQLVTANPGPAYDSLGSPTHIGIGDIEVSALFKLVDGFADTTAGVRLRGAIRGVLRLGTGRPPTGTVPYEVGTGTGQTSADGGAIFDIRFSRRFMTTLGAQYTAYFTSAPVGRLPNSDYSLFPMDTPVAGMWREGDAVQAEAMPRISLTDYFAIHGAYTFRHQAASKYTSSDIAAPPLFEASTEQRVGLGFGYSTVARYARSVSVVPLEVFYTHLETIMATGGLTPKYRRDQIEFRIYYRLRRPGR